MLTVKEPLLFAKCSSKHVSQGTIHLTTNSLWPHRSPPLLKLWRYTGSGQGGVPPPHYTTGAAPGRLKLVAQGPDMTHKVVIKNIILDQETSLSVSLPYVGRVPSPLSCTCLIPHSLPHSPGPMSICA